MAYKTDKALHTNADPNDPNADIRLVEEDDPEAAFLLAPAGGSVPAAVAARLGLTGDGTDTNQRQETVRPLTVPSDAADTAPAATDAQQAEPATDGQTDGNVLSSASIEKPAKGK